MPLTTMKPAGQFDCPDVELSGKRCRHYQNRLCALPAHPLCEEWLKKNPTVELPAGEEFNAARLFLAKFPGYRERVVARTWFVDDRWRAPAPDYHEKRLASVRQAIDAFPPDVAELTHDWLTVPDHMPMNMAADWLGHVCDLVAHVLTPCPEGVDFGVFLQDLRGRVDRLPPRDGIHPDPLEAVARLLRVCQADLGLGLHSASGSSNT